VARRNVLAELYNLLVVTSQTVFPESVRSSADFSTLPKLR
jgi:hypothetical protein